MDINYEDLRISRFRKFEEDIKPLLFLNETDVFYTEAYGKSATESYVDYIIVLYLFLLRAQNISTTNCTTIESLEMDIKTYNGEGAKEYQLLFYKLVDFFKSLSPEKFRALFDKVYEFQEEISDHSISQNFEDLCDYYSDMLFVESDNFISKKLFNLLSKIVEIPDNSSVYNPYAGPADIGIELSGNFKYFGQEKNIRLYLIGLMRLIAASRLNSSKFILDDMERNWNPAKLKFDFVISIPPVGVKRTYPTEDRPFRELDSDLFYCAINDFTSTTGKLIAIVPNNFLVANSNSQIKHQIIKNDLLESVINLPKGILSNTSMGFAIIVLNNNKANLNHVNFINGDSIDSVKDGPDYSNEFDSFVSLCKNPRENSMCRIVSNSQIEQFDYNLLAKRYFKKDIDGVSIMSFCEIIHLKRTFDGHEGKIVSGKHLSGDSQNYVLDTSNIGVNLLYSYHSIIEETCLLITSVGFNQNPTIFFYHEEPIYISPNIIALRVDSSIIDIHYLSIELRKAYVKEQFELLLSGLFFKKSDLQFVKINLPSIDKQREYVLDPNQRFVFIGNEVKERRDLLTQQFNSLNESIVDGSILRHKIRGRVKNLKGNFFTLYNSFDAEIKLEIEQMLKRRDIKLKRTFAEYLDFMKNDLVKIYDAVDDDKNESSILEEPLEDFNIFSFIDSYCKAIEDNENNDFIFHKNFEQVNIDIAIDMSVIVRGSKKLLEEALNNLIENAVKHAFPSGNRKSDNHILLSYFFNEQDSVVVIIISNSGLEWPHSFSFEHAIKKGFSSGANKGDGTGLWYVNEIAKRHEGKLLFSSQSYIFQRFEMVTRLTISLPGEIYKINGNE
ncbi:MAG: N-6 DNA methylase [Bacteroidales bacterium]|nr:N-6 DNA methylase [Bacteroidales bacterium]